MTPTPEPVDDGNCTANEREIIRLCEQVMILSESLENCHKLVKFNSTTERDKVLKVMRPQVLYFALRMEEKLRKHDKDRGSRGWVGYTQPEKQNYLFRRLVDEVKELKKDINLAGGCGELLVRGSSENIDVGNIAMMLYTAYYGDESAISMIDFLMHELRPPAPEAQR